jgi:hypothetical protein
VELGKNSLLLAGNMYVRKFTRTDTGCSILWSSESLLGCTQAVPSCGQVKAELTCSFKHISMVEQRKMGVTAALVAAKNSRK